MYVRLYVYTVTQKMHLAPLHGIEEPRLRAHVGVKGRRPTQVVSSSPHRVALWAVVG